MKKRKIMKKLLVLMLVVGKSLEKRLKLYFSDLKKVREKILGGGIINLPYLTLQRDRRIVSREVKNERRKNQIG